jgi:casein kinase II subunit alpha
MFSHVNGQQCKDVALVKTVGSRAHWHHYDVDLIYGNSEDYRLIKRLGEGSYGEAYFALNVKENYNCVIKIYKDKMSHSKMMRELLIMQNLCGGPNIIKLLDVVREGEKNLPAAVIEYVNFTDHRSLFPTLSDRDVRFYMRNLLKAMDHMHRNDVIHRDIKPSNMLIDHQKRQIRLIDFGISRFHYSGANHSNGGTLNYIAPEVLLEYSHYNSKVDLWSFGVMLAGIIFQRDSFFKGGSPDEQLAAYTKVLGTQGLIDMAEDLKIPYDKNASYLRNPLPEKSWSSIVTSHTKKLATPDALHALGSILKYNPKDRLSAADLLRLPYFL